MFRMKVGRLHCPNIADESGTRPSAEVAVEPVPASPYESRLRHSAKRPQPCAPRDFRVSPQPGTVPALQSRQPVAMIKAEPIAEGQPAAHIAANHARLQCLSVENLEEAARALRGTSRASKNCVTLAKGMLDYLRTGVLPGLASEPANTLADFAVRVSLANRVKQEPETNVAHQTIDFISQSKVINGGVHDAHMPTDMFYSIERGQSNEIFDALGVDLTQYTQPSMTVSESAAILKGLAQYHASAKGQNSSPAIYGLINLIKFHAGAGHQVVYFARPGNVMFVDCQKIYQGRGAAVSSDLEKLLPFNDNPAVLGFQTTIFVTPIYPASSDSALKNKSYLLVANALSSLESLASEEKNRYRFHEDERLDRIIKIIRRGLPNEALILSKHFLMTDASSATLHSGLGLALTNLRHYDEALNAFDKAIALNGNEPMAHRGRSLTLTVLERFDEALAAFDRLILLAPDQLQSYKVSGQVFLNMRCFPEALTAFDRAIGLGTDDFDAHQGRGFVLGALNRHNDALVAFNRAVEINSQNAITHRNRGMVLSGLGRDNESLVAINGAVAIDPKNSTIHCARAIALNNLGQLSEALTAFSQSLLLSPNDHVTYAELGRVLYQAGLHADALSAYNRSICINAHNPQSYRGSGNTLIALQRYAEALIPFRWAISQTPDDFSAYKGIALALAFLSRFDEASLAVEKAISLQPDDVSLWDLRTAVQFGQW